MYVVILVAFFELFYKKSLAEQEIEILVFECERIITQLNENLDACIDLNAQILTINDQINITLDKLLQNY